MPTDAQPAQDEAALSALRAAADRLVEDAAGWLVETRQHLHAHPELSSREAATAAFVADQLRAAGVDEVRTGVGGHGVVGVLRGGRPGDRVIALRADMDGLPVQEASGVPFASTVVDPAYPGGPFPVAHACGHDCHMATVLASARVLADMRDELPGSVVFLFQPAEEGPPLGEPPGAQAMVDAGALADPVPTMVFGMHVAPLPRGHVGYREGVYFAASCMVRIEVVGVQTHGSTPWLGADPMPAAAAIIGGVGQLYRQVPAYNPVSVSIGHVQDIGRFNIIGGRVTLVGTVRALDDADMALVQARLRRLAEHSALAYGCTATTEFHQDVPAVRNTPEGLAATLPTVRRVVGEDRVVAMPPFMGYDDVSVLINACGGAYLSYGVQDTRFVAGTSEVEAIPGGRGHFPNHHPSFYADDDALLDAVRIHVQVAIDHLTT